MDELKRALEWHKQAVPNPTIESACVQIGCHYEEVAEMAQATNDIDLLHESGHVAGEYKLKKKPYMLTIYELNSDDRNKILGLLCKQIVTAAGVAHSLGFDLIDALKELNDTNYSKLIDGKAVLDANGKIDKPASYNPPQLERFIKG